MLRGGAATVFRTEALAEAAGLAVAIARIPGLEGSGTLLTIAETRLTVRRPATCGSSSDGISKWLGLYQRWRGSAAR